MNTEMMPMNGVEAIAETAGELSVVTREQTEIQSAIIAAKKFPRKEQAAFARAVRSFERVSMAEAATYGFPRGGKQITGPSVDCARELARCWGNIRYGLRVIAQTNDRMHIKGYALDLETNSYVEAEDEFSKLIQRKVDSPQGKITKWVEPDERDLRELTFRRGAILVRNCILQILPPDLVDNVLSVATQTLAKFAKNELKENPEDAVKRIVLLFDRIGVTVGMLEEYLSHPLNIVTAEELASLRQIGKAIADGAAKREEFFILTPEATPQGTTVAETMKNKLRGQKSPKNETPPPGA